MELKTNRLTLTPISLSHLDSAYKYSSDKENTRLMVFLPHESKAETAEHLRKCEEQWKSDDPEFLELALLLGDTHIGAVTVYFLNGGKTAELGWILDPRYQKKGYLTEAALEIMKYIKDELKISHVIAQCDSENTASIRLTKRLGMTLSDDKGVRQNRSSPEERREFTFEKYL